MDHAAYHHQAKLLLNILPIIDRYPIFGLKGGTAINFFIRDLPRLSVDIDLTYLPVNDRNTAFKAIEDALVDIKRDIERLIRNTTVLPRTSEGRIMGLNVRADGVMVKIEPNLVLRGTAYEPQILNVTPRVQEMFEVSVKTKILATEDIYGGKICAALDRQHPRDLLNVKLLLDNEGLTDQIRRSLSFILSAMTAPCLNSLIQAFRA